MEKRGAQNQKGSLLYKMQLTINFEQPINKPWWSGIPCQKMQYFDLLSQNVPLEDIMKPWTIEDYEILNKNTETNNRQMDKPNKIRRYRNRRTNK